jgi:hypothetical protein
MFLHDVSALAAVQQSGFPEQSPQHRRFPLELSDQMFSRVFQTLVFFVCPVVTPFGILHHHSFLIKCIRFECHFHHNKRNRPANKTRLTKERLKERESVCVAFVYAQQQQQQLLKAVQNCIDFSFPKLAKALIKI